MNSLRFPPALLLMLATLFWSGNILVGRSVGGTISPVSTAFWRFFPALIILAPFMFTDFWRYRSLVRKNIGFLILLSVAGIAGFQTLSYLALSHTTAVNASLFLSLTPVFVAIISFALGDEKPGLMQGAGISVSLLGVMVLISRGNYSVFANLEFNNGDVLMMAAVPLWALYSVLLKRRPKEMPAGVLLFVTIFIAVLSLMPFYLWDAVYGGGVALTLGNVMTFAYLSLFASVLAYLFWNSGVRQIGAVRSGPFMHLVPVFATVLAILLLGEKLYLFHYIGIPLIALGIWLNSRTKKAPG